MKHLHALEVSRRYCTKSGLSGCARVGLPYITSYAFLLNLYALVPRFVRLRNASICLCLFSTLIALLVSLLSEMTLPIVGKNVFFNAAWKRRSASSAFCMSSFANMYHLSLIRIGRE